MSPDARETTAACAADLTVVAATLRKVATDPDMAADQRERDGIAVLAAEIDSIIEGIGTLLSGGGEK